MRFKAIQIVHPQVVTLRGNDDARDQEGNSVALNAELIAVEVARLTQEAAEAKVIAEAKEAKIKAINDLIVTTTAGNTFDADDASRANMNEAITASAVLGLSQHTWKLADNTVKTITLVELKEALAKAIQAKGAIILG